jgi:hypothetical protein
MVEVNLLIYRFAPNFLVVLAVERQVPSQHEVNNNSERPTVNGLVLGQLHQNFGCHVAKCSVRLIASLSRTKSFRKAEVHDLDVRILALINHQDIFWLKVTMCDTELVEEIKCSAYLMRDMLCAPFGNYKVAVT